MDDEITDVIEQQLANLVFNIKDWQITHGMLLKYGSDVENVNSVPVGVSLLPSSFPKKMFEEAQRLQHAYNRLYAAVSEDDEYLYSALRGLIEDGSFAATLWKIHEEVKREGYIQPVTLGIFRSDYMIHKEKPALKEAPPQQNLRQIEFNTYSVAGGVHSDKVAEMHQFMHRNGSYDFIYTLGGLKAPIVDQIPHNRTTAFLVSGLCSAHAAYGPSKTGNGNTPGILFVVQPRNLNVCDERPLEYALWDHEPSIPAYRVIFGEEVLAHTYLSPSRDLLYQSPSVSSPVEIAVVYMRAGYDPEEYTEAGCAARLLLEKSRAIKCPSILCHLATFKKVQQELTVSGVLKKYLTPYDTDTVKATFAPMYPMDDASEAGRRGRALALDPDTARNHVLKPSLEGGAHNIYGTDIPHYLISMPESEWHTYVLMELVKPFIRKSMLLTPGGMYYGMKAHDSPDLDKVKGDPETSSENLISRLGGPTVSELGIIGVCLWERENLGPPNIIKNEGAGWTLKTKPSNINEMSVAKGYGCFDSPYLTE